jgi:uncharacterized protein YbbC (DUF1343 family)
MRFFWLLLFPIFLSAQTIKLGVDRYFEEGFATHHQKKKVGLITNHTGVDQNLTSTIELFRKKGGLVALFSPEHGISGAEYATAKIENGKDKSGIKIFSLHGETKRPTEEMLQGIDLLVFDIQEVGCRSYTYISTLFYVMEEAAKKKIPFVVLDRPNPMGGKIVDGPMLEEKWRSFLGYVNVPYCHGMTVGELALFFNEEYKIGCQLQVVPMVGWKREMTFKETGLTWVPTSPYIPEPDTPFYYATTGILGALGVVNIGIGYTLPFKVIGAPWIVASELVDKLNGQKLPGVKFLPFHYKPFYGKFKDQECQGVQIVITDPTTYRPVTVQYLLIGMLKSMYPNAFKTKLGEMTAAEKTSFCKVNGSEEILRIIEKETYSAWKLIGYQQEERKAFLEKRKKYLLYE